MTKTIQTLKKGGARETTKMTWDTTRAISSVCHHFESPMHPKYQKEDEYRNKEKGVVEVTK